ncbi:hypothetical protein HN385_05130 [archaeon]|jgi:hypothetical protein|nr:hypothetical protein [archaeon]MBT3451405.1 hypothetical protein [archaeon]MBT6869251.1 hypothetical protein [archaeon]MBT7193649.1 hypothetical protein [archaeon]MBT7380267.1 hypothetical protein [archaeon]
MEDLMYSILLIGIGSFNIYYSSKFIRDSKYARKYVETMPKAWLIRKIFGVNKAIKMTRKFFAPLGLVMGVIIILMGLILLIITI